MKDLFGDDGARALAALAAQKALYAFDFDGTLAPIVARPDDAAASPSTVALLTELGAMVPTLLLTGRAVDDLRRRIDFTPLHLVGNHGAEGLPPSLVDLEGLAAHRAVVDRWLAQWPAAFVDADPAIELEQKAFSLSLHYRRTEDHAMAQRRIAAAVERLEPRPRVIGGKCVVNLLPVGSPDKGQALKALVAYAGCTAAFFIGDDVTDETAFVDVPPSWVTVRVGRSDDSAARFYIDDQRAIDRCLRRLIAGIRG